MIDTDTLRVPEQRPQQTQFDSDVAELDRLLHPHLTFVGPNGALSDKDAEFEAHRSGTMRIEVLEPQDLVVRVTDRVGITVLTARLEGEYAGNRFSARIPYTRSWANSTEGWRIVAVHASRFEPTTT